MSEPLISTDRDEVRKGAREAVAKELQWPAATADSGKPPITKQGRPEPKWSPMLDIHVPIEIWHAQPIGGASLGGCKSLPEAEQVALSWLDTHPADTVQVWHCVSVIRLTPIKIKPEP